jgi:hypothetical protein
MNNPTPQERFDDIKNYDNLKNKGFNFPYLQVKNASYKGLGVFTTEDIKENQIVEFCHCLVLGYPQKYTTDKKILEYTYRTNCSCDDCKKHGQKLLIPFGYGSIYNSAETKEDANCHWYIMFKNKVIIYKALRNIKAGEEILPWFGENYYNFWCKKNKSNINVN